MTDGVVVVQAKFTALQEQCANVNNLGIVSYISHEVVVVNTFQVR